MKNIVFAVILSLIYFLPELLTLQLGSVITAFTNPAILAPQAVTQIYTEATFFLISIVLILVNIYLAKSKKEIARYMTYIFAAPLVVMSLIGIYLVITLMQLLLQNRLSEGILTFMMLISFDFFGLLGSYVYFFLIHHKVNNELKRK
ncbi:MAG TPA: hypothetical protein VMR81_01365 [Patescibacteria group bacterium]|nr:hypothetical protein [Patescibacteria group bacterium]